MRTFGAINKNLKWNLVVQINDVNHEIKEILNKNYINLKEISKVLGLSYDSVYNMSKNRYKYNKGRFDPIIKISKIKVI